MPKEKRHTTFETNKDLILTAVHQMHIALSILRVSKDCGEEIKDLIFEYANDKAALDLGFPSDVIIGESYLNLFPHINQSKILDEYITSITTQKPFSFQVLTSDKFINMQNSENIDVKVMPYGDRLVLTWERSSPRSTSVNQLNLNNYDFIEKEIISEKLKIEQQLKRSEERFRATFEQAAVGIAHVSLDGHFMQVNEKLCEITGYNKDELQHLSFQEITVASDLVIDLDYVKQLLSGEIKTYSMEKRYIRKDGSPVWINLTGSLVHDLEGKPDYFIAVIENIDDKKKAEQAIFDIMDKLERSNRELEQFAYIASHDLQEPIRIVSNYTTLLERRFQNKLDETGKQIIKFITDGSSRMFELVQDLLSYSKISHTDPIFEKIDLNNVISAVLENLKFPIQENHVAIYTKQLPTVVGDHMQFVQLFQNLISNSIKYRHPDRIPVIHIEALQRNNEYIFSIRDNGIGIEKEFFNKIFLIFQRLHNKNEFPGTGIGLTICKKIVEHYRGRIWVESQPGNGSVFYFSLPIK